jgi:hypothetical protein
MALQINNQYCRVENFGGAKNQLVFVLRGYENSDAEQVVSEKGFVFKPNGEGRWDAQAYSHLKTLPEFAGATDC